MVKLFIPGPQKIADPLRVRVRTTLADGESSAGQEAPCGLGCGLRGMGRVRVECSPPLRRKPHLILDAMRPRMGCEVMECSPLLSIVEVCGPSTWTCKTNGSKDSEYNLSLTYLTICSHFVMIYQLGYFQKLALYKQNNF